MVDEEPSNPFTTAGQCSVDYPEPPGQDIRDWLWLNSSTNLPEDFDETEAAYYDILNNASRGLTDEQKALVGYYRKVLDRAILEQLPGAYANMLETGALEDVFYWLKKFNTSSSQVRKAKMLIASGNLAQAQQVLSTIPDTFELSEAEENDLSNLIDLLNLVEELPLNQVSLADLESIYQFENIGGQAQRMARNILTYKGANYPPELVQSGNLERRALLGSGSIGEKEKMLLAFPNPSNGSINFSIPAKADFESGVITIKDLTGKLIWQSQTLFTGEQVSIRLDVPEGIYLYQLLTDTEEQYSDKLIINN